MKKTPPNQPRQKSRNPQISKPKAKQVREVFLSISVVQAGAEQISAQMPLSSWRRRAVHMGSHTSAELFLPHSQLPKRQALFRVGKGKVSVQIDPRFEGFLNDGKRFGTIKEFVSPRGSLRDLATVLEPLEVPLTRGARGCLSLGGYEILFRVDFAPAPPVLRLYALVGAGRGFLQPAAVHLPIERWGFLVGALCAAAFFGPLTLWLLKSPREAFTGIAHLPEDYATALVHPDHYAALPFVFRERLETENPTSLAIEAVTSLKKRWEDESQKGVELGLEFLSDFPYFPSDVPRKEELELRARRAYQSFHSSQMRLSSPRFLSALAHTPRVFVNTAGVSQGSFYVRQVRNIRNLKRMWKAIESQGLAEQEFLMEYLKESGARMEKPYDIPKMEVITGPSPSPEFLRDQGWRDLAKKRAEETQHSEMREVLLRWSETPAQEGVVWLSSDGALAPAFLVGKLTLSEKPVDALIFNARLATGQVPLPPPVKPKPVINMLDVDLLVYGRREEIRACYESALKRNSSIAGEVRWHFGIDEQGKIVESAIAKSSISDRAFLACLKERVESWKFPKSRNGISTFQYPFRFRKSQGETR
jgi:hypothetical protein